MAELNGFIFTAKQSWPDNHLNLAALDQMGDVLYEARGVSAIKRGLAGVITHTAPVETVSRTVSGSRAASFADDFYHRVHINPSVIDLGNMATAQTREVEVWNAHLQYNTLEAIVTTDAAGMTLEGPETEPTTFTPLETRTYTLTVTPNGPATADALFRFDFTYDAPTLRTLVRRIVGWVFAPNWSEPVLERLEWLTNVLESYAGAEQRVRLRAGARRSFEYSMLIGNDNERVRLENLLHSWQSKVFGLPLWQEITHTTAVANAGELTIPATLSGEAFSVGTLAGLLRGHVHEFVEITAIGSDTLTIKSPLERTWPAHTRLLPVQPARLQNALPVRYVTDSVAQLRVQFMLEEEWQGEPLTETEFYQDTPVLLTATNWREELDTDYTRKLETLDFLTGRKVVDDLSGVATVRRSHRFLLHGREAIAGFRAWLAARAGKLVPFWLPAQQSDIKPVSPVKEYDFAITVENRGFSASGLPLSGRQDIMITTDDGQCFYRSITGATELSDTQEVVGIDDELGVELLPEQIRQITFMSLLRLDSDAVEIAHHTDQVAEVVLTLRSLKI